jgi:hypothetical protein
MNTRLWTDEAEVEYRVTPRDGGRWSGGVYLPPSTLPREALRRPGLFSQVVRSLLDLRTD